jgi:hypothetical protein
MSNNQWSALHHLIFNNISIEYKSAADLAFAKIVDQISFYTYIDLYCEQKKMTPDQLKIMLGKYDSEGIDNFRELLSPFPPINSISLNPLALIKTLPRRKKVTNPEHCFKIIYEVTSSFGDLKSSSNYQDFKISDPYKYDTEHRGVEIFHKELGLNYFQLFPLAVDKNKDILVDKGELATAKALGIDIYYTELSSEMIDVLHDVWKRNSFRALPPKNLQLPPRYFNYHYLSTKHHRSYSPSGSRTN